MEWERTWGGDANMQCLICVFTVRSMEPSPQAYLPTLPTEATKLSHSLFSNPPKYHPSFFHPSPSPPLQHLQSTPSLPGLVLLPVGLVVCLLLHPAPRISPQDELSDLIIDEDEETVGEGTEPPSDLERVHAEGNTHSRAVR